MIIYALTDLKNQENKAKIKFLQRTEFSKIQFYNI